MCISACIHRDRQRERERERESYVVIYIHILTESEERTVAAAWHDMFTSTNTPGARTSITITINCNTDSRHGSTCCQSQVYHCDMK